MGQRPHPGRHLLVCAAIALAGAPFLVGCSSSVADSTTTLQGVLAATVVHTDGTTRPAIDGLALNAGDVLRTGSGGRAELVTRNRVVYVGSQAAVQVVDGAHQVLRLGAVVVDAQHDAPALEVSVGGLDVTAPSGSAVRAEQSVTARIGALAGRAEVRSSAGRRLTIDALHQAMVGGDALPDSTTPLRLTDDDGEAHAVPDLVRDDETLNELARGIDSTGPSTARVVEASWTGAALTAPAGVDRSERLLPAVIAATGPAAGVDGRYNRAVADRKAGGSWGVIAHLLGVPAQNVVDTLAAFERTQPAGQIGSVGAVLASAGVTGTSGGHANHGAGGSGNDGNNTGTGGTGPGTGSGGPSPTPSPSSGGAVGQVLGTVDNTVGQVLSILPTPVPTPTKSVLPLPLPLPSVSVPLLPTGQ